MEALLERDSPWSTRSPPTFCYEFFLEATPQALPPLPVHWEYRQAAHVDTLFCAVPKDCPPLDDWNTADQLDLVQQGVLWMLTKAWKHSGDVLIEKIEPPSRVRGFTWVRIPEQRLQWLSVAAATEFAEFGVPTKRLEPNRTYEQMRNDLFRTY